MKKLISALLLFMVACGGIPEGVDKDVTIYKSASCGCCGLYAEHLKQNGFSVKVVEQQDISSIKEKHNIPSDLRSCHTAEVGGYFVEGHVPAEAIIKLLQEKPDITGIALPGMPSGSPGMPGRKTGKWAILGIRSDGSTFEFMSI